MPFADAFSLFTFAELLLFCCAVRVHVRAVQCLWLLGTPVCLGLVPPLLLSLADPLSCAVRVLFTVPAASCGAGAGGWPAGRGHSVQGPLRYERRHRAAHAAVSLSVARFRALLPACWSLVCSRALFFLLFLLVRHVLGEKPVCLCPAWLLCCLGDRKTLPHPHSQFWPLLCCFAV